MTDSDDNVLDFTEFLDFPGCRECAGRPCMDLRFGRTYAGKLQVLAGNAMPLAGCPLACRDSAEAALLLEDMPLQEVIFHTENALDEINPGEALRFRLSSYCSDYRDRAGRVRFMRAVLDEGLVVVARIPEGYERDRRLAAWFGVREHGLTRDG